MATTGMPSFFASSTAIRSESRSRSHRGSNWCRRWPPRECRAFSPHRPRSDLNHVVDPIGGAIGVDDGHHGNAELFRLIDRDLLVPDVDDEERIGQRLHVLDAAQALLQLIHLAAKLGRLLL